MHDIFISYSHKDSGVATAVLSKLEQNKIRCWIDYRDATPGDNFGGSIVRAIKHSKFFVLLLSENSSASAHVLSEVNSAVKAGITIIPFKIDGCELNESFEYYLGKTHWLEALTPPMERHIAKLTETIRNYMAPAQHSGGVPTGKKVNGCRVMKLQELYELGYTAASVAIQLVENDYINFNGIGLENEGTAEQWEEFLQNDSDTFRYLVNENGKVVGDWSIVALTPEAFDQAMQGQLLEQDISIENTQMLCFPDTYNGYILTMGMLPQYRTMENYNLLIDSLLAQIEEYSENGIFFQKWCINVFSRDVEAMVRRLGFAYVCNNKTLGKIYACDFMPLPKLPLLQRYQKMVKNYEPFC